MNKKEYADILLGKLKEWQSQGMTSQQAVEKLTLKQYDFLIDYGIDLDDMVLTAEQKSAVNATKRASRSTSPNGYRKVYPQEKMDLFNDLVKFLTDKGAVIMPTEKCNYRDLDFTVGEKHYKIVLSNPRK